MRWTATAEPSLGLAPLILDRLFNIIQRINGEGITILLVEQNATRSLEISHRGDALESGKVALAGSKKELYDNEEIKRTYLGM